jgi:uncharacterized membrane protein (UPF0127 family)
MKNKYYFTKVILSVFALAIIIPSVSCCSSRKFKLPVKDLHIITQDGRTLTVRTEIAERTEERNYGFMNRKKIPDGTGMLFVFESDQVLNFWMKDTPTPLSIAYIDSMGTIKDIFGMTPYSLADVTSTCSVRYALEVPRGWYTRMNIKVGDKVNLDDIQN